MKLVSPHLGDARALARHLMRNRADSEDVVQDACIRSLRNIEKFSDECARAWLLTIVRHAAYDCLNRKRRARVVAFDDVGPALLDRIEEPAAETPESELIAQDNTRALWVGLASLPPVYRDVLVLRDQQDLSYREIATKIGVPIGTVMSRLARARRRLARNVVVRRCGEERWAA